jgi:hypothetical protein
MTFTQCGNSGVYAWNTKGRLINCVITQCKYSGIHCSINALIELEGDQTKVDGNVTRGSSWYSGLDTNDTSSIIHLLFPLTKESVSTNNHGGRNYNKSAGSITTVESFQVVSQENKTSSSLSSSSSSSSEASITQQLRTENSQLRSEITELRSENDKLRSLHTVHVIDVDKDNEESSYLPPTKTLHDNKTRKRKRVPVEKILSDANKVAKVKIEKVNNLLDDSKKATKAAEEEAQKAADALEDALECILCMDNKRDTLFLPCCHLNTCGECASMHSVCPTCKQPIERQVNNVYIS